MVWLQQCKVTSNLHENLYDRVHKPRIMKRWEKQGLLEGVLDQVDWEANEQALQLTPILQRHWLSKPISGMCGVGKMMKIWGHQQSNACPCCGEPDSATLMSWHVEMKWQCECFTTQWHQWTNGWLKCQQPQTYSKLSSELFYHGSMASALWPQTQTIWVLWKLSRLKNVLVGRPS